MKFSAVRRWKKNEKKFNQKYKLKIAKKASNSRDYSGKFLFLISNTNLCAILKFLSRNVCVTESLVEINSQHRKLISSKFIVPPKRHRKILAQSEVRITEKFKFCCLKYLDLSKWETVRINNVPTKQSTNLVVRTKLESEESKKKIMPLKILSCKICNEKFLKKELLDTHISKVHFSDEDNTTDSESELYIHENVKFTPAYSKIVRIMKDPIREVRTGRNFKCLQCSALCATEESLLAHIERTHPCSSSTASPRPLLGYNFSGKVQNARKRSISSTSSSFTTNSKQSSVDGPDPDIKQNIKYQRFDSNSKVDFCCRICSATFPARSFLNRHIMTIHLSKVFKCFQCSVPFNKKLHLVRHLQTAHLKYKEEEGYIATLEDLESVGYFQCCFCKYSSKIQIKVEEHLVNEHYEDFEKGEDSISSSPDSLEELLLPETRALREQEEEYEAELLTEMMPNEENEANNFDELNRKRKRPNDPSFKYRCARCLKRFSRSNWLKRHPCVGVGVKVNNSNEVAVKKTKLLNAVNGFFRCSNRSCSQVFTDRRLYDFHLKNAH